MPPLRAIAITRSSDAAFANTSGSCRVAWAATSREMGAPATLSTSSNVRAGGVARMIPNAALTVEGFVHHAHTTGSQAAPDLEAVSAFEPEARACAHRSMIATSTADSA